MFDSDFLYNDAQGFVKRPELVRRSAARRNLVVFLSAAGLM